MEFELNNKRSKRRSLSISPFPYTGLEVPQLSQMTPAWKEEKSFRGRDEKELEERIDKFYALLGKIKAMRGLWRNNNENKRVKPVVEPVWQPTFSLEDFEGVEGQVREMGEKKKAKKRGEMERPEKEEDKKEEKEKGKESEKEHHKRSEEMEWVEVEDSGINLNLSL